jgi:hypothetical protein
VDQRIREAIRKLAQEENRSLSNYILTVLLDYLKSTVVEVSLHFSALITLSPFQHFIHRLIKHQALGPFFAKHCEITKGNQGSREILRS